MKQRIAIVLFIISSAQCVGQKNDNIWLLSYSAALSHTPFPDAAIDFSNGNADTFRVFKPLAFFNTDASICDSSGKLLFYTNGQQINNRFHQKLWNSYRYNPGWCSDKFYVSISGTDTTYQGLGLGQSCLILPAPYDTNLYYIFHESADSFFSQEFNLWSFDPLNLRYSVIDMRLNADSGGIIPTKKSIVLINDTLLAGRLTAVRHANGRDWWIVSHKQSSDLVYIMLLSDTGVSIKSQHLSSIYHEKTELPQFSGQLVKSDYYGQVCFSPDGSKYAMTGWECELLLADFDRCKGEFNNVKVINTPIVDSFQFVPLGCAFSPSGRYLYVNLNFRFFQYDTWEPNLDSADAVEITWITDSATTYLPFTEQLAPDGKIYINTFGGTKNMHIIDKPDLAGNACHVIQNGLTLPQYNTGMPNFPYFRLHEGNECDTIVTTHTEIILYPNPSNGQLTIAWDSLPGSNIFVYDVLGREVSNYLIPDNLTGVYGKNNNTAIIDVSRLAAGMYIMDVRAKSGLRVGKKFIVER